MSEGRSVLLGDVCEIVMGQAPPGTDCNKSGKGTVFVKAGEFGDRRPVVCEWTTNPLRLACVGDVLVCVVGATAGKINESIDCAIGRSVAAVRPNGLRLQSAYLYHFLKTQVLRLRARSQGLAQGVITREMLEEILMPLPPLPEQWRIAEMLDRAEELQAKRRAALGQLDALTQSIFLDMFGDPVKNPKGWTVLSFSEVMQDETACSEKLQQSRFLKTGRFPVIDQGQTFTAGYSDDESMLCRSQLPVIVFGDHTRVIKLVLNPFVIGADGAKVLVPKSGVAATFLAWLLRMSPLPDLGYSRHMREVRRLRFPVPPRQVQEEFAARTQRIEEYRVLIATALNCLDRLFASLQHRAFRGEL